MSLKLAPIHSFRTEREAMFLDQQPAIQRTIRQWCESLDLDSGHGVAHSDLEVEEIECRSRDGFIRASHNFGGFDATLFSDVDHCNGSGSGPNLKEIDRQVDQAYSEAIRWFKAQAFIGLEHLTDDEITYDNLYKLGRGDLAEQLSEVEREWMDSPVWWGIRAMYEGYDERGVHTLMIYASGNVDQYYGAFGKGSESLGEWTVKFKTVSGLARQLKRLKLKVESAF